MLVCMPTDSMNSPSPPPRRINSRSAVKAFLVLVLSLPVVYLVLVWISNLLEAMGDEPVVAVLGYFLVAVQIVWLLSVVGLVLLLAVLSLEYDPGE